MADLPLDQVPREGEIVEVLYRLSRPAETHLDLTVATDRALRRLRFSGARVVQFQEEPPSVLQGLDVQDIRKQDLGNLALWVSIAEGAITFWAQRVVEMTQQIPAPRTSSLHSPAEDLPIIAVDQVRNWAPSGTPPTSFYYRKPLTGGTLRGFSVGTRRYL